jgi:hypothetical protein
MRLGRNKDMSVRMFQLAPVTISKHLCVNCVKAEALTKTRVSLQKKKKKKKKRKEKSDRF